MYKIGEALVGKNNEVAHVDLMIGEKEGLIGQAFANGMTNLSVGHTPLLSVIRPNLPCKPYTLIVPKVTVGHMEDVTKIFGPAQSAVAKAIADSVEEGVIPRDKVDEWVIICSVFIHPEAKDFRRIYQYNYGATKLALKRALSDYPGVDKIMFDKDRATHPIMGFRVSRLPKWNRPYLQIALDAPDLEKTKKVIEELPKSDKIILEAGTPLIKKYGVKVISELREVAKDSFIIADMKTLDVGQVEVDIAFDETADAVVASGLATVEVIDKFIYEAKRLGIYAIIDTMNVPDPVKMLSALKELPDIAILHRSVDSEKKEKHRFELIGKIKKEFPNLFVAVAGGIEPETAPLALKEGADILIVGRFITQSRDVERSAELFINILGEDIDLKRVHVE
ncbi:MAG: bifunctional 5,6,7,8-tetrahydromethanopterin hydro-lyase/3-hexulose-6-phosphate synthase [Candidatus Altiarchaeota archaeon]|nr:bifunctional 5,6,7,8-tetrahydromethanopterin hydro-lyase/3-hexulose-6-phosphate synthase [Candidatus Altiarchaeota archaeon]